MKRYYFNIIIIIFIVSCNNKNPSSDKLKKDDKIENLSFFPVTNYIKGQLLEINQKAINPVKYITINDKKDSSILKFEDLPKELACFLSPIIDSTNLLHLYTENKFYDQTLKSITLTYDPKTTLTDSIYFKHWEVYINPETGKVKRIFLIKKMGNNKTLQLTWVSNNWCNITTIITNENGSTYIEKSEKISWSF